MKRALHSAKIIRVRLNSEKDTLKKKRALWFILVFAACRGAVLFSRLCPLFSRTDGFMNTKPEEVAGISSPDKKETNQRKVMLISAFLVLSPFGWKMKKNYEPLVLSLVFFCRKKVEVFCECSLNKKWGKKLSPVIRKFIASYLATFATAHASSLI